MTERLVTATGLVRTELELTTAEILYYLPDYPDILQSFIWQHYDTAPGYPRLRRFLDFWRSNIEATLAEVKVAQRRFTALGHDDFRKVDREILLH